jgi:deoxyribodipyrimidine photo-lyase
MNRPALVWFRRDLRLSDHAALIAAARMGPVIPVYVHAPDEAGAWRDGAASRWWLQHSLAALDATLRRRGSRLVCHRGDPAEVLVRVAAATDAVAVVWHRRHEAHVAAADQRVTAALAGAGVGAVCLPGPLLIEPARLLTAAGTPYRVFTPFWRVAQAALDAAPPAPVPASWESPAQWPAGLEPGQLALDRGDPWTAGLAAAWEPGEAGANRRLETFVAQGLAAYAEGRDQLGADGISRLSPHLAFGELSVGQVWHAVVDRPGATSYLRQLGWREFNRYLLHHFPSLPERPLNATFAQFPWVADDSAQRQWQRGTTGFPLVDAGMRQLWATGWMHNRVRMVAASFLVKDLLVHWRQGAAWFWDTLVDADLANNTCGWQWTAGCGADAAPFFRVFNPATQAERYDPDGAYVRRWVPELARLPAPWIHRPSAAPTAVLAQAGVRLGQTYPQPLVDHAWARQRALRALALCRQASRVDPDPRSALAAD